MPGNISIIGGTGAEGFGLALRFAHAGARIHIGSRDLGKAHAAAQRIREMLPASDVEGCLNADAAAAAEIAILTVPLGAGADRHAQIGAHELSPRRHPGGYHRAAGSRHRRICHARVWQISEFETCDNGRV